MVQLTFETAADLERRERLLDRVRELMLDHHWRTLGEIRRAAGGSETGVSARLRDLRKPEHGGFTVESRRRGQDGGLWEYRVA